MADKTLTQAFTDIANAIRAEGVSGSMTPAEMSAAIGAFGQSSKNCVNLGSLIGGIVDGTIEKPTEPIYLSGEISAVTDIAPDALRAAFSARNVSAIGFTSLSGIGSNGMAATFRTAIVPGDVEFPSLYSIRGMSDVFYQANGLSSISFPVATEIMPYALNFAFFGAPNLKYVEMPKVGSSNSGQLQAAFSNCTALTTVDFSEASAIVGINANSFNNTNNNFVVGVPNELYEDWCEATNWSQLSAHLMKASSFKPLRITVDGDGVNSGSAGLRVANSNIAELYYRKNGTGGWQSCNGTNSFTLTYTPEHQDYYEFIGKQIRNTGGLNTLSGLTFRRASVNDNPLRISGNIGSLMCGFNTGSDGIERDRNVWRSALSNLTSFGRSVIGGGAFGGLFGGTAAGGSVGSDFTGDIDLSMIEELSGMTASTGRGCYGAFALMFSQDGNSTGKSITSVDMSGLKHLGGLTISATTTDAPFFGAFDSCSQLSSVNLSGLTNDRPDDGSTLNNICFNCGSLVDINLDNLKKLGGNGLYYSFYNCSSLTSVNLGELLSCRAYNGPGMSGDGSFKYTFSGCSNLQSVYLNRLAYVGVDSGVWDYAFAGCPNLRVIDFSDVPTGLSRYPDGVSFNRNIPAQLSIYVPADLSATMMSGFRSLSSYVHPYTMTKAKYTNSRMWWEGEISGTLSARSEEPYYTDQIPNLSDAYYVKPGWTVDTIEANAFANLPNLKQVEFRKTKAQVKAMANLSDWGISDDCEIICLDGSFTPNYNTVVRYTEASGLPEETMDIEGTLSGFIGWSQTSWWPRPSYTFRQTCTSQIPQVSAATSVSVGSDVTFLRDSVFYQCTNLQSVSIPKNTNINGLTFKGSNVTSVTMTNRTKDQVMGIDGWRHT